MQKQCVKCLKTLELDSFPDRKDSKDGKRSECRVCIKGKNLRYYLDNKEVLDRKKKRYIATNKEAHLARQRKWTQANKTTLIPYHAEYSVKWREKNKEKIKRKSAEYYQLNKSSISKRVVEQTRRRALRDPVFRMVRNKRTRIAHALEGRCTPSSGTKACGCTPEQLRNHLQSLWEPGMNWDNYGKKDGWVVDHIKPCAGFMDLSNEDQFKECFHYSNLQPLWYLDNLQKKDKSPQEWQSFKDDRMLQQVEELLREV